MTLADQLWGINNGTSYLKVYMVQGLTYQMQNWYFDEDEDCLMGDNGSGVRYFLMRDKIISMEMVGNTMTKDVNIAEGRTREKSFNLDVCQECGCQPGALIKIQ